VVNELWPFQRQAITEVVSDLDRHASTLLVLPTGTGKTRCCAHIAEHFVPQGPVLVLANRGDLVEQADRQFKRWTSLPTGIEMAERTKASFDAGTKVVIASIQSISRPSRLTTYDSDAFSLIITDEGHHGISDSFRAVYQHFAKRLQALDAPARFLIGKNAERLILPFLRQKGAVLDL